MKGDKPSRGTGGFTLIELLVVIAIIGLLASVILASVRQARMRAVATRAAADLHTVVTAIQSYETDHNDWPGAGTFVSDSSNTFGRWTQLATMLQPYINTMVTPSYRSIDDGINPGVVVTQGYIYDKGDGVGQPLTIMTTDSTCQSNCSIVACIAIHHGYWLDFILPAGYQSYLSRNDSGMDPDGIESYDGDVVITRNPTAAQLADRNLCPP